jgi:DNA-binding CsgD family transcriptional regulator
MTGDLVERGEALAALGAALREVGEGQGRVVLIAGEAGIGKTSVLRAFAASHPSTPLWWGACDALQTPHPLSPLHDIARESDVRFGALIAGGGSRAALFDAVLDELRRAAEPVLVVIEDAHWADEATLDLIKFLGRRIVRTRSLLAVTYRDDEVGASHPLRRTIGELPSSALTRLRLDALSAAAVEALSRRAGRNSTGLHRLTRGNPFFVTELLRCPGEPLPPSVQDLVLARYARLPPTAQKVARLAALVPARIEGALVDAMLSPTLADLEACLDSGLLLADGAWLHYRHELARVAVESSLAAALSQSLHAQVLRTAAGTPLALTPARLLHHALRSADEAAIRQHAPVAADEAQARGAHREAASHYLTALQHADDGIDDATRVRWLEAAADACNNVNRQDDARAARLQLDVLYHRTGDVAGEAINLSRLALIYVGMTRNAEGEAANRRAIALAQAQPPGPALVVAYGVEASLRMLNRDLAEAVQWADKAIELAERFGDRLRLCQAMANQGAALMIVEPERGRARLLQALQLARDERMIGMEALALSHLGSVSGEMVRLADAEHWLREGIAFMAEHEFDRLAHYSSAWLALCEGLAGRWSESADRAGALLERESTEAIARLMALLALGRARLRRGDPGVGAVLDEAQALAAGSSTLQRLAPVAALRAEAAWQRGDAAGAAALAQAVLPLAQRQRHPWFIGELSYWCWRAGTLDAALPPCAEPYALQLAGRWRDAAGAWAALGCPYESARALADGDEAAQREALAIYEQLGARPAAEALRARLYEAGVRGLARGPRAATREHPFGLTARELQTLQLLCEGLRNAEIAARLHRSVRTVDHHLAAVFAKLGVDSRTAAVAVAQREGLAPQSGQARRER